MIFSSNF